MHFLGRMEEIAYCYCLESNFGVDTLTSTQNGETDIKSDR
jgi:hypothetical protein